MPPPPVFTKGNPACRRGRGGIKDLLNMSKLDTILMDGRHIAVRSFTQIRLTVASIFFNLGNCNLGESGIDHSKSNTLGFSLRCADRHRGNPTNGERTKLVSGDLRGVRVRTVGSGITSRSNQLINSREFPRQPSKFDGELYAIFQS